MPSQFTSVPSKPLKDPHNWLLRKVNNLAGLGGYYLGPWVVAKAWNWGVGNTGISI